MGKTAIIIGATSGLGREVAGVLVRKGWKVGISGRRIEALESFRNEFGKSNVFFRQMDVTDEFSVQALDSLLSETGCPDLFLHVSGVGYQNIELDEEKELLTVKTNCEGMVRMVDHFINFVRSHMDDGTYTSKHKAQIAVITSVAGTAALGTAPAYSATKKMQSTYITALSQLSRMEKLPIRFTDIKPGFVSTDILNPDKHYPIIITKEKAAGYIVKGIEDHKRVLIFDWRFKLLVFLWRLIPRAIWERLTWIKWKSRWSRVG